MLNAVNNDYFPTFEVVLMHNSCYDFETEMNFNIPNFTIINENVVLM